MMKELDFLDVDYCQFSDWGYQKPTRIWGSPQIASLPDKICDLQTCDNMMDTIYGVRKHFEQLGGNKMKFSTIEKYRMPTTLVEYLLSNCKEYLPNQNSGNSRKIPKKILGRF